MSTDVAAAIDVGSRPPTMAAMLVHRSPAPRRTILVTGFGAFPGAARNPTETIVAHLVRHRARFDRLGIDLHCVALPVRYGELQTRLTELVQAHRPEVILHLGVAGRRRRVSVETRAINRANPLHADAARRCPPQVLLPRGAHVLHASYRSRQVLAALGSAGVAAVASRDAGDYVCNATLYLSLAADLAPEVGFIHVPKVRGLMRHRTAGAVRPSAADLTRAVLAAVIALVPRPVVSRDLAAPAEPPYEAPPTRDDDVATSLALV